MVLPKRILNTDATTVEVLTTPIKKSSIILPKKIVSEDKNIITKTPIKNMFMGYNNDIPVLTYYIASDGDMVKIGMYGNTSYTEIVNKEDFTISTTGIITYIENPVYDIPTENNDIEDFKPRTRTITKVLTDALELCEINYGYARKLIIHKSHGNTNIDDVIKYESRNRITPEKTYYEGVLICSKENEDIAKHLIKEILKLDGKASVNWL